MISAPVADDLEDTELRLDKWLWAARFYKTRGLAAEAIKGGKVEVNGQKAKPSKNLRVSDELRIRRDPYEYIITVLRLNERRGPATEAATLYQESQESIERRQRLAEELKTQTAIHPHFPGRPSKRDRRQIIRFTRKQGE
jgi:ribosome-associated heat shock protein Hsp15